MSRTSEKSEAELQFIEEYLMNHAAAGRSNSADKTPGEQTIDSFPKDCLTAFSTLADSKLVIH